MSEQMTDNQLKMMQLRNYQAMPLGAKITRTKHLIREWYEAHDGLVYVAFSGGKDSTVLLDLVWQDYPDVPAVFADTGNELNTVREFVKGYGDRITWVKPKMTFDEVVKKLGYPVISKEQSGFINEVRQILKKDGSKKLLNIRMNGNKWNRGKISDKWKKFINAPFDVTHKCCKILKIDPTSTYRKETKRATMVGVMADESELRMQTYIRFGCNAFDLKDPTSRPIIFWTEQDVLQYITDNNLPIAGAYGEVINRGGNLSCTGEQRTGCKFCLFGLHMQDGENRIQKLSRIEPESYRHAIEDLKYDEVMDFYGVDWKPYKFETQTDMFDPSYEIDAKELVQKEKVK
jgi:3'-phosphoadenosine 5'-phosphosulfate sulfotransferase (PAPS reductase)/FAD synthetase